MEIEQDSFEIKTKNKYTQNQDNEQLNELFQIYCFFFYYQDQLGITSPSLEQLKQIFYCQDKIRNKNLEYFIVQIIKSFMKIMFSGDNKNKSYKMVASKPSTSLLLFSSNIRIMFKDISLLLVWPQVISEILEIFDFPSDRIEKEQIRNCTPKMFNALDSHLKLRIFQFFIEVLQKNLKVDFSPENFEKKENKINKKIEELKQENSAYNKAEIQKLERQLFFLVRPFVCIGVNKQQQNVWILDSEPSKLFIQLDKDSWSSCSLQTKFYNQQLKDEIEYLKKENILIEQNKTQKQRNNDTIVYQDLVDELKGSEFSDSHLDMYYQRAFNYMLNNYELYDKDPIEFIKNFLLDIFEAYTNYIDLIEGYFGPSIDYRQELYQSLQNINDLKSAKQGLMDEDQNFSKVFVKGSDNNYEKYSFVYWHYYVLGLKSRFKSYLNKVHLPYQLLILCLTFNVILIQLIARKHKYFDQEVEEQEKQEEYYTCGQCKSSVDPVKVSNCKVCKKVFHYKLLTKRLTIILINYFKYLIQLKYIIFFCSKNNELLYFAQFRKIYLIFIMPEF